MRGVWMHQVLIKCHIVTILSLNPIPHEVHQGDAVRAQEGMERTDEVIFEK